jgi:SAM-dependent methyltransferase
MPSSLGLALRAWAERDGRGYPDWALRYLPVVRELRRRNALAGRILEIGANANGLARFAAVRVIAADLCPAHLREARDCPGLRPCAADISRLPFPPGTFDCVVCVDTFEHLPEALRAAAATEILRVLAPRGTAVVAFPTGAAAQAAEERVRADYARHSGGARLRWLEEHVAEGLPDARAVAACFQSGGASVRVAKNANLRVWAWTWRVLMCGWPGRGNAAAQVLLRVLTPLLARVHVGACYRAVLWIARDDREAR